MNEFFSIEEMREATEKEKFPGTIFKLSLQLEFFREKARQKSYKNPLIKKSIQDSRFLLTSMEIFNACSENALLIEDWKSEERLYEDDFIMEKYSEKDSPYFKYDALLDNRQYTRMKTGTKHHINKEKLANVIMDFSKVVYLKPDSREIGFILKEVVGASTKHCLILSALHSYGGRTLDQLNQFPALR